ncbi:1,4-dihydroxy-2-naphthoate prenyltransferase [Melghiribacillus thermohalophilus]|uniref:1,4-dihydroxy-2-naphthoate octaprenyltransferase n=1 Tax=Melghiribacillus thermohalophilus TaxID=1324956 RepID=A0A4R3MU98_9BACI|nr:1,4-dihydroxy-2-naphthoate polyprenyltransferase [Melghiribacillus thermohalophilus]TCT17528.1 1,4-dihydroxy-2-naphthoate prenyltransferase [Melghiribacillus thermohalophilus]
MQTGHKLQETIESKKGWNVWWRMLRPHTLTASFIPVFAGTMLASFDQTIHVGLFIAMLLASILIQAATNMFNEYYDYVRGLDHEESVGIGGTIVRDGIRPKTVLTLAMVFFLVATFIGIYICMMTSWWIAVIGAVSMACGYLYTGGPYPIAYTPFGELVSGFFMGTIIIGISYYIQTLSVDGPILMITIPFAIFIGAIMLSNNIRDLDGDRENGRKTLAILVGKKRAIRVLAGFFLSAYLLTILYILSGILPWWTLMTLLSGKKAIKAVKGFIGRTKPIDMLPAMKSTAQTNTMYGLLFGLSLILQHMLPV